VSSSIYNDEARWLGAAKFWRPPCDDGCAQGGDIVWRHGDIDGETTRFMQIFIVKIARRFDGGDGFYSVCMRYSLSVC
jgi:hypothetical protein